MISSATILVFLTVLFGNEAAFQIQTNDSCLTKLIQGQPGEQGPSGPVGPKGPPGLQGSCTCDLSEVISLRKELENQKDELEEYNKTIYKFKAFFCHSALVAEQGWYNAGNNYQYLRTTSEQNWQASRNLCQAKGGDLAYLGIRNLNIRRKVFTALLGRKGQDAWIGLSDIQTEGTFRWLDGTVATRQSINWAPHEPNNVGGNEDCVHLNWQDRNHPDNSANDFPCSLHAYALCEKPITICK